MISGELAISVVLVAVRMQNAIGSNSREIGTPVRAPADGVVRSAERDGGYGNTLTLDHGDGIVTRYGHLSAFRARPGQRVHRGDVVAFVGNTGRSSGSHVHYEIVLHGAAVDPLQFLPGDDLF